VNLNEMHLKLVQNVNNATTKHEHDLNEACLSGFRMGLAMVGGKLDWAYPDLHYMHQGINRPMCCGVWLDWEPME